MNRAIEWVTTDKICALSHSKEQKRWVAFWIIICISTLRRYSHFIFTRFQLLNKTTNTTQSLYYKLNAPSLQNGSVQTRIGSIAFLIPLWPLHVKPTTYEVLQYSIYEVSFLPMIYHVSVIEQNYDYDSESAIERIPTYYSRAFSHQTKAHQYKLDRFI